MRVSRASGAALIALAALAAALAVAAALLTARPLALQAGAAGDAYFFTNTYPPERGETPLRWTREAAGLQLHGAYAGPLALELRLYREPSAGAGPWPLTLRTDDTELGAFDAGPGWRRYALALPPRAALAALTLESATFQPGGGDARELGVAISELRALPLAGAPPLGYALGRAAWLGALLALVGAAVWLLDAWCLGAAGAAGRPWRALALTAGLGAALALWAWLAPASLAWALPTRWDLLAWGVVGVGAFGVGAFGSRMTRKVAKNAKRKREGAKGEDAKGEDAKGEDAKGVRGYGAAPGALASLVLAHAVLLAPAPAAWREIAALLILLAPGALAALALFWKEADGAERAFLAVAGGLAVAAMLVLAIHALPGPAPGWVLLLVADGLSALGVWALLRQGGKGPWRRGGEAIGRPHRWLALPLLLGAATRLWGLGVGQFQGDEAYAMMLAKGVLHGQEEILLVHMKGPVEALLPAGVLALTGTIAEMTARLPFTLASLALILGVWSLAGRMFGGRLGNLAGFAAAMGVAVDGLLVAFGRILQYQAVVMLLSAAALWLCWRFYEGAAARRTLLAAAFCAAVALLAHYDGMYVMPALAWLVFAGGRRRGWGPRQWAGALAPPLALGLLLTLSFYLPFVLHEHFGRTLRHLATRSGQGGAGFVLYNNLPGYAAMLSVYASRYVAAAAALALLAALAAMLARYLLPAALGLGMAALLVLGGLLAVFAPGPLALGPDASLAALLVLPPLLALVVAPPLPPALRALALWHVGALAAHAFLLADPRTHFYTAHVAGWLIVGWGLGRLWGWTETLRPSAAGILKGAVATGAAAALTVGLAYVGMVFLRPWPEYERAYPASQLAFFRPLSGDELPDDGIFGFPARDGWKAAAALFADGTLRGSFDSNQELFTWGWYLRGQYRCQRSPDFFLTANGATPLFIPTGYSHFGTVLVDGVRALEIYSREPAEGPPQLFDAADFEAAYDAAPVPNFPLRRLLSGVAPQLSLQPRWAAGFGLRGLDLDRHELGPGDSAFLTLYWRADVALPDRLVPVVLLRDGAGQNVGEAESYCGGTPAEAWHGNYVNDTSFRIEAEGLAPGAYTLHVGVRDLVTGAWLPLEGGEQDVKVAEIVVR